MRSKVEVADAATVALPDPSNITEFVTPPMSYVTIVLGVPDKEKLADPAQKVPPVTLAVASGSIVTGAELDKGQLSPRKSTLTKLKTDVKVAGGAVIVPVAFKVVVILGPPSIL